MASCEISPTLSSCFPKPTIYNRQHPLAVLSEFREDIELEFAPR
jgi:hypothetical protein